MKNDNALMNMKELREILASTIRGLKSKRVKSGDAKAIYGGTQQLMATYRLEMEHMKQTGRKALSDSKFLPTPAK